MINKEFLKTKYLEEELSIRQIGYLLGCSGQKVLYWMNRHGISSRKCGVLGKNNPMYGKHHTLESRNKIKKKLRKMTEVEFKELVESLGGVKVCSEYSGENYPIDIKCTNCGHLKHLKQAKNAHVRKFSCKICEKITWQKGFASPGRPRKYGLFEVVKICEENNIKFLDDAYHGIDVNHNFNCDKGHKFLKPFSEMLRSFKKRTNGCRLCLHNNLKTPIETIKEEYNNKGFVFLDDNYSNSHTKHKTQCLKCSNIWTCVPYSILHLNSGCPRCNLYLNQKLTGDYLRELFPNTLIEPYTLNVPIVVDGEMIQKRLYIDYRFEINDIVVFVEYNGIQHYQSVAFNNNYTNFKKQNMRDNWLRKYCIENKVVLIEIDGRKYVGRKIKEFLINNIGKYIAK